MPIRVPTYDAPKVERANLAGGENTSRAIPIERGQTANLIAGALGAAADLGDRVQQRRDLDEAFRVETQVMADYSAFEQNLRKTRRGASAIGVVDEVDGWWAKVDQTYGKDVSPRVKELTQKSLARVRAQALERIGTYQMGEEDRAQVQSFNAVNGQEIQNAIVDGKPEVIAAARVKIGDAVRVFGATRGWSPDEVAAETQKWANVLHQQALGALVDASPAKAKEYFEANRKEIDSAHHARIDSMIGKAVAERKATDNAVAWAALPFEEAIAKARAIPDEGERKMSIAAVRQLQEEKNIARSLREKEVSDQVWQQVANGVPMAKLPKALLEQMDGRERMQVNAHYEAERKRREVEAKGGAVKTDMKLYEELMSLPPDQFRGVQFSTFADRLSRGDMEQLINRKASLKDPKQANDVATTEQQMGSYINSMGLKDEKKGAFQKTAYDEFNQFRAANKREPNYDERQKILDRLSTTDGGWFGQKRFFELKTTKERNAFVDDAVPAADRTEIIKLLQARKIPVTAQTILDTYLAGQR